MSKHSDNLERLATEAYEKHTELEQLSPSSWRIRRPGSSTFLTTIIAAPPFLIMVGDAETAVFQGHHSDSPLGLVRWVASSGLGYLGDKIEMGMNVQGCSKIDDSDEAVAELEQRKAEELVEFDEDPIDDTEDLKALARERIATKWDEAIEAARRGEIHVAREYVAMNIEDGYEFAGDIGRVIAPRVVYAREACRAMVRLYDAEPVERIGVIAPTVPAAAKLATTFERPRRLVTPIPVLGPVVGHRFDRAVIAAEVDPFEPKILAWLEQSIQTMTPRESIVHLAADKCGGCNRVHAECLCNRPAQVDELEAAGVDCGPAPCGRCGNEATVDMECGAGRGWRCACGAKAEESEIAINEIVLLTSDANVPMVLIFDEVWRLASEALGRPVTDERPPSLAVDGMTLSGMSLELLRQIEVGLGDITRDEFEKSIPSGKWDVDDLWLGFKTHPLEYCLAKSKQGPTLFGVAIKATADLISELAEKTTVSHAWDGQFYWDRKAVKTEPKGSIALMVDDERPTIPVESQDGDAWNRAVRLSNLKLYQLKPGMRIGVVAKGATAAKIVTDRIESECCESLEVSALLVGSAIDGKRFDLVIVNDNIDFDDDEVSAWLHGSVWPRLMTKAEVEAGRRTVGSCNRPGCDVPKYWHTDYATPHNHCAAHLADELKPKAEVGE